MGDLLIDRDFVRAVLTYEAPWCGSHGAEDGYLGMGLLYYALAYIQQAQIAVCLGSGGGFVPRLMRQAQRDLGIAHRARTILVDANLPEAGWGAPAWLNENSFFRRTFADIEIVLTTTGQAAEQVFASQELTIDLLHIDADHSFEGCLDDFRRYRGLLRVGSLVTLHDTSFPGAGVSHVVEHLRTRDDCDVIDLPDIGFGTAIVRIVAEEKQHTTTPSAMRLQYGDHVAVMVRRKPDTPALAPPHIGWKYLESEAFSTRSVVAAHFLRDCPMVIEIGGGRATIDSFLTGRHQRVVVVDPFLRERRVGAIDDGRCAVQHIRARFQDVDWRIEQPGKYGLVMLGLELQGLGEDDRQMLYALVNGARATVIEFPTSWQPSCDQFRAIRQNTRTCERFACKIDLSGNPVGDLENSWPPRFDREIHVLEPLGLE
jgi:predicted O-methyltransferase YrrM